MRKLILYIAMSLDGYIADSNGSVDWLVGDGSEPESMGSYHDFYSSIDTVVLGYKTYQQIVTELSPNNWVYADKQSYVITHNSIENTDNIIFTDSDLTKLLADIRKNDGGNIWLCGGASLVTMALQQGLIDEYNITIIPTILGAGTNLFDNISLQKLKLISTMQYNGIVDLKYTNRYH